MNSVGNEHELLTVKAGQFVSFECNAAAQPQPRIRWFRLSLNPNNRQLEIGKAAATTPTMAGKLNKLHSEYGSQIAALSMAQRNTEGKVGDKFNGNANHLFTKLDETQIRSSLLQMDTIANLGELLNRFEITSSVSQSKGEPFVNTKILLTYLFSLTRKGKPTN